jgi:hypothetical protein
VNDIAGIVRVLSYAAKKRIELAEENKKNGIPDPLNDLAEISLENALSETARRKLKSKLRKKGKRK